MGVEQIWMQTVSIYSVIFSTDLVYTAPYVLSWPQIDGFTQSEFGLFAASVSLSVKKELQNNTLFHSYICLIFNVTIEISDTIFKFKM